MAEADERGPAWAGGLATAARLVRSHAGTLGVALGLELAQRGAWLVAPGYARDSLGRAGGGVQALAPMLLVPAVGVVAGLARRRLLVPLAKLAVARLRAGLHAALLDRPASFFDGERSGALVAALLHDAAAVEWLLGSSAVDTAATVLAALLALPLLAAISGGLTAVLVVAALPVAAAVALGWRRSRTATVARARALARLGAEAAEAFAGVRTVKGLAAEPPIERAFGRALDEAVRSDTATANASLSLSLWTSAAAGVGAVATLAAGAELVSAGRLAAADVVAYVATAAVAFAPLGSLGGRAHDAAWALGALARLDRVLDGAPPESPQGGPPLAVTRGEIRFEAVRYAYPARGGGDVAALAGPALLDVSCVIPGGSWTTIVGPSGAGKSTLVALLAGLDRPSAGRIAVDGTDLAGLDPRAIRRCIGLVPQDARLFHGTLRENLRLGRPDASDDDVARACRATGVDAIAAALERGSDTLVGELGAGLSGGQRQRVAIARALVADRPILVLDEATSSIDPRGEASLRAAVRAERRGRTTILVTHRIASARGADHVIVVDEGRIVEAGEPGALLARGGRFAALAASVAGADEAAA